MDPYRWVGGGGRPPPPYGPGLVWECKAVVITSFKKPAGWVLFPRVPCCDTQLTGLRTHVLSVRVPSSELNISAFPPVLRDWVIKGLGMSSLIYATGHIKDPVPLIAKRRGLSPGGRFPPSFIHHHDRSE